MTLDGFTFYGGVSHGVEKRSKVRSRLGERLAADCRDQAAGEVHGQQREDYAMRGRRDQTTARSVHCK